MFRIILILLSLLTLINAKTMNVAVFDLQGMEVSPSECLILTNKLRAELVKTKHFTVLDRSEMETILQEQGLQQTGCTSSECAVELGQLLGMTHIINGSIGKIGDIYYVETKVINVESSEIEKVVDTHIAGAIEKVLMEGLPFIAAKLAGRNPAEPSSTHQTAFNKTTGSKTHGTGVLDIQVSPSHGDIYLDDSLYGRGDMIVEDLAPGIYTLSAQVGIQRTVREVAVDPNSRRKINIKVEPTSLYIEVEPDWAKLYINDQYHGRGDCDFGRFEPGNYKVELRTKRSTFARDMVIHHGGRQHFEIEMPGYED